MTSLEHPRLHPASHRCRLFRRNVIISGESRITATLILTGPAVGHMARRTTNQTKGTPSVAHRHHSSGRNKRTRGAATPRLERAHPTSIQRRFSRCSSARSRGGWHRLTSVDALPDATDGSRFPRSRRRATSPSPALHGRFGARWHGSGPRGSHASRMWLRRFRSALW
jgi:hypothetical protein